MGHDVEHEVVNASESPDHNAQESRRQKRRLLQPKQHRPQDSDEQKEPSFDQEPLRTLDVIR